MSIKTKLTGLIFFILVAIGTMYGLLHFALQSVGYLKDAQTEVSNLESSMLLLRRHEKDFLARDDIKYLKNFDTTKEQFLVQISNLENLLHASNIQSQKTSSLREVLGQYSNKFHQLAQLKEQIGFSPESGLRGNLRKAVHGAEEKVKELGSYQLLAGILQLRRNEKDFLIRKDLKYRDKFEKNFQTLLQDVDSIVVGSSDNQQTKELLNIYRKDLLALISNYEALGLDSKSGLLGEMRKTIHQSETLLEEQASEVSNSLEEELSSILMFASIKALIIAAIVSSVAFWIAQNILSRVNRLKTVMGAAREKKDLSLRYEVVANDELSEMGNSFNSMMSEFQRLLEEVNKSSLQLSAAAEEVSSIAVDTSRGLDEQKAEVTQVSAAVREMESAMHEISHNTDLTAQTAQNSQESAGKGQEVIGQAIRNINHLAEDASQSAEAVAVLEENSNRIGSVLDVIKEIAEQTNLLALNASIEAARAGEHGRGFSVVADEVRALAGRSQESATEIEEMINNLQTQTSKVSELMQRSIALSNKSADEATGSISALDQIMQGATHIVDMTTQVASAVEEQTAVAGEINNNADRIQSIVETASIQVSQNAQASEEVARQAAHLQQIVSQFKVH